MGVKGLLAAAFIGAAGGPWRACQGDTRRRAPAGLELESEPGSRWGTEPMGGAHLAAWEREEKGERDVGLG
jgi:hypothetical protein